MRAALALRGPNARSSEMKLASHSILPAFEFFLKQRGRRWLWSVHTAEGTQVVTGSGCSRSAAAYEANRALFLLLLSAPYRFRAQANRQARRRPLAPTP